MCNLGTYYEEQGNFDLMIKYYIMALEQGQNIGAQLLERFTEKYPAEAAKLIIILHQENQLLSECTKQKN